MNVPVGILRPAEADLAQRRVASSLAALGVDQGDRVALVDRSTPALFNAVIGSLRAGIVPVIVKPQLTPVERAALLADAEPARVIEGIAVEALAAPDVTPADVADVPLGRPMLYTSGTTGRPKGVWTGVLSEDAGRALVDEEAELWAFEPGERHIVASVFHHSAPLRFALGALLAGGEVLVPERFDPGTLATEINRWRPTSTFAAPTHLARLFANDPRGTLDLSGFRLVAHAGSSCPEPLKRQAIERFPSGSVWEFYGSTEGQFTACSSEEWEARPGTVGRARPGRRLRIGPTDRSGGADPNRAVGEDPRHPGESGSGMVWCEVPDHARFEYWRDPERTAASWDGDAFTVGDLGRLDADGYLFLDGRRDDLVITGGVNVYPAEVERALEACPGVAQVVVFGVDDDRWGQRVVAAVIGDVGADDVRAFARSVLAPEKRPKHVLVVDEIPHTPFGKVRRSTLATEFGVG